MLGIPANCNQINKKRYRLIQFIYYNLQAGFWLINFIKQIKSALECRCDSTKAFESIVITIKT